MKTLYIECKMGVAGDMLAGALLDLFDNQEEIVQKLNNINVPKVTYRLDKVKSCGISGNHLTVLVDGVEEESVDKDLSGVSNSDKHNHKNNHDHAHDDNSHHNEHLHEHEKECSSEHAHLCSEEHNHDHAHGHSHEHHSLYDVEEIIESLQVSKETRSDIREIYQLLAEAESRVHGTSVSEIHFHEVGNLDAIADIAAVCCLMHELDPDKIIVSPINVGGGQVKCAHGILPVPTPATALLLEGIPSYGSETIKAELCTPTGAALVKYFAFDFMGQPPMIINNIGYGMGKKEFVQANCVRVMYGEMPEDGEKVVELSCNIDDMTAEEIGFAQEMLFDAGALDVYTISIAMKKNRPGTMLVCMCREDDKEAILKTIYKHTTTIGVRENSFNRYILNRELIKRETPYGDVHIKKSYGYGVTREKFEYEDLAGIARRTGKSLFELKEELSSL